VSFGARAPAFVRAIAVAGVVAARIVDAVAGVGVAAVRVVVFGFLAVAVIVFGDGCSRKSEEPGKPRPSG